MKKFSIMLALLAALAANASAQGIFVETESFTGKGGWSVDQQFMDLMGSPYLIAHGMGIPVKDAETSVEAGRAGRYHVYVRTYNWTSPWTGKKGPGAFAVSVNGRTGPEVGVEGDGWQWQYAGTARLRRGRNTLSLVDLAGFDGRCDAVWLTRSKGDVPPEAVKELESFRRAHGALPQNPQDGGEYDFVVVGGGVAGMCAAASAARLGLKVALVNDRPVLGGNNSSEIRVHLGGKIEMEPYPALGRMLREFGHSRLGNAKPAENYEDSKKDDFIAAETGIRLWASCRAVDVRMDGDSIASVIIRDIASGEEYELKAPLFADCTGDANLGYMAGADWTMGREGRDAYGEPLAPEVADSITLGASVQWYSSEADSPVGFPEFEYGISFTEESCEKTTMGEWTWETGMNRDQIREAERIRDYGLLVIYSNWSFLKNSSADRDEYARRYLDWVAYLAGKRESRRLLGDHILTQRDVVDQVEYDDASFTTTWHFDLHFPDPRNSKYFPGEEFKAGTKENLIHPYAVPYRCLYSRNIGNLFMAGRNISVSHVALGSTRLMRTTAMMGEVVGMAACICRRHDARPRAVYQHYLPELKQLMSVGAARPGELPDNQHFNEGGNL